MQYSRFSIVDLENFTKNWKLFKFVAGIGGHADVPDSAMFWLDKLKYPSFKEKFENIILKICTKHHNPSAECMIFEKSLNLSIKEYPAGVWEILVEGTDWGLWKDTCFGSVENLEAQLESLDIVTMDPPDRFKTRTFKL